MGAEGFTTNLLLADLAAPARNALVGGPFGSDLLASDYTPVGVPVIRGENLATGRWVQGPYVFVSPEKAAKLASNTAGPLDLVFTQRGANHYRQVGLVPRDAPSRFLISQSQMKLTVDPEKADPLFVYYLFRAPEQQDFLKRNAISTGVPHTNLSILKRVPLRLPPLHQQRAIAHILGTLDDKIELNRRMNETLEEMARALFKSWFVDFDPVRRKAGGRDPGLPKHLADLFPSRFVDSELGEIPEGWGTGLLGEICSRVAMGPFGSDIKTSNFVPSGVPVVRGGNLTHGFVDEDFVFLTEDKADQLKNANAFRGDIVITHRGTLGQVGLIPEGCRHPRYVVSQSQMVVSADRGKTRSRYIYAFLRSRIGQHALLANTSQTGVPAISRPTTSVRAILLLLPPMEQLCCFDDQVAALNRRQEACTAESRTLLGLRDVLLPKLISGELRVKDADRFLAKVTA